ncbi:23S rRNA (uracil-5-)-methyltransferase RumA [Acetobacter orientalis]|uniref:23S rRNA (Uracil-5-)-methyltransferase RumA n=1 Tax=Acetobacter orientalis TaxID=146474 RepID=A0A2Z5ZKU0_9PROT|nr:23S rRNA (uracil-5-)-methyltransferase RumA [Acetobacter orientalis]
MRSPFAQGIAPLQKPDHSGGCMHAYALCSGCISTPLHRLLSA